MVESDVLTVVLPYIREDFTAVQFKLLGFLRMLCDGQGANNVEKPVFSFSFTNIAPTVLMKINH